VGSVTLPPPERLTREHDTSGFDSGSSQLDPWLRRRALANEASGASRTYVVCEGRRVVAFYVLATGAVLQRDAPGPVRRNMPDPIPVMVLGRLAVDRRYQGYGLGKALLRDAALRILQAAEIAGIRAILVHAKDERAAQFYQRSGFMPSPIDPMTLMLPLKQARAALAGGK
jgi:GNAT superfamily N-acetyltransferase